MKPVVGWAGHSAVRWMVIAGLAGYVATLGFGVRANAMPAVAEAIGSVDDWDLDTGFERTVWQGRDWDLHPTATHHLVRAEPVEGEPTSVVFSPPFAAPDRVAVFYHLVAYDHFLLDAVDVDQFSGISLVCTTSSATLEFPIAETNDRVAETVVTVPVGFCSGPVVLEAHAQHQVLLDVSAPHRVDRGVVESRGLPSQLLRHLAIFTLFAVIGLAGAVALARLMPRLGGEGSALLACMLAIGLASYAAFFVYWMSPTAGRVMSVLVIVGGVGFTLNELRRSRERTAGVIRNLAPGLLIWFLVSAFAVTLLYSVNTGAGPWQANSRYFPAVWSSDNNLPMMISEGLYRGEYLPGVIGGWHVSDRGPLQAGTGALLRPLVLLTDPAGISGQRLASFHHITGITLNTMWVLAIVGLGVALGWGRRLTQGAIVLVALSPIGVFNSTYVWPKMAAAAFGMVAILGVIELGDRADSPRTRSTTDWVLAAVLAALALLCHASIFFFLLAAGLWLIVRGPRPSWRPFLAAVATAVIVMVPWMSWQRLVDPPGNALIKYALAGTFGFDEPDKSVLDTVVDTYRAIGFDGWWDLRTSGVRDVTVDYWSASSDFTGDQPDATRMTQQLGVAPALGPAILAVVAVTVLRGRGRDPAYRANRRLVLLGLLALATNVLVFWGPQILVTVPLATIMALTLGGVVALRHINRWVAAGIAAASVGSCLVVWIADPLIGTPGVNVAAATLVAVMALIGMIYLGAALSSTDSPVATREMTTTSLP